MGNGLFDDFVMQFDDGFSEHVQDGRSTSSQVIVASPPLPFSHSDFRSQPSVPFETLQERVEGAGTDVIAVPPQFGEHPLADHWVFRRVMQDMHLPEAQQDLSGQEFGVRGRHEHRSWLLRKP
jgi:hypothetical protein